MATKWCVKWGEMRETVLQWNVQTCSGSVTFKIQHFRFIFRRTWRTCQEWGHSWREFSATTRRTRVRKMSRDPRSKKRWDTNLFLCSQAVVWFTDLWHEVYGFEWHRVTLWLTRHRHNWLSLLLRRQYWLSNLVRGCRCNRCTFFAKILAWKVGVSIVCGFEFCRSYVYRKTTRFFHAKVGVRMMCECVLYLGWLRFLFWRVTRCSFTWSQLGVPLLPLWSN